MQDEKLVVLRKPVVLGDVTYADLALREPTAGELSKAMREGAGNNVDMAISLISQIAKVPKAVVSMIGQRDFTEANDFLASFTSTGQESGETSSPN